MKKVSKAPTEVLLHLVCVALLTALQVVLSRFLSIQLWNLKIGFSFVPVIIAARLFGPLSSVAVYAMGDLIGTFLFPTGPFFPGFTLTAAVSGLIYGVFLGKKFSAVRVVGAAVLNQLICSLLMNSFWIAYTSGTTFTAMLSVRWPQSLGMCIVQIVFMMVGLEPICNAVKKILKKTMK
ncbi:MAG: folate family ECF transporter S component [Clostridia bacterium]|nr:folate family ECF transporter S component [Clostridia bacterium]